jgi:hypothetical protein
MERIITGTSESGERTVLWWPDLPGAGPMRLHMIEGAELAEPVSLGPVHIRSGPITLAWGEPLDPA